jgi:LEA14-like dessication related protein
MKLNRIILALLVVAFTYQSCDILKQMVSFTKCEFKMNSLSNARLANVMVQNKKSYSDFTITDVANVTKSLVGGKLPLTFDLNIEVKNPNTTPASMQKMEWRVFLDDIQMAEGVMDQKVSIQPGANQIIPLSVAVDLKKVFNNETKNALINLGLNLTDAGGYPTRVRLDIKPTIYVGSFALAYPGYFSLKKEFGSN